MSDDTEYEFVGGFPTPETVQRAYDDADLNRAVYAYRLFFASVSALSIVKGNEEVGVLPNESAGTMDTLPRHVGLTLNSDTPYAPILLDLRAGPMVIELPPGPMLGVMMDLNQRWVLDMGIPGPDAGNGGRHLLLPPDFDGPVPGGYFATTSPTYRLLGGARALPLGGDLAAADDLLRQIRVRPLDAPEGSSVLRWSDLTPDPQDTSPNRYLEGLGYWELVHEIIDTEPGFPEFRVAYGDLAALGIAKGRPFEPDERDRGLLERAARIASAQMRVQSFADRRPDRVVWPDRRWEWAALRFENGDFELPEALDTTAREKWYYQAIGSTPAMFRRDTKAGSLYWLGLRDASGHYLDGGRTYRLTVPLPVPGRLFWSVTAYDAQTRSQIDAGQGNARLSTLFEMQDLTGDNVDLFFGPEAPAGSEGRWLQTVPGRGWFVYFRIYGPEQTAFDGTWRPGDFAAV